MALWNKCWHHHFGQFCNSRAAILCLRRAQHANLGQWFFNFFGYQIEKKTTSWFWEAFSWLSMSSTTENDQKRYTRFYRSLLFTPISIESSQFWRIWMTFNHLKTNFTKLADYRLEFDKLFFFYFFFCFFFSSPWCNIPFEQIFKMPRTKSDILQVDIFSQKYGVAMEQILLWQDNTLMDPVHYL